MDQTNKSRKRRGTKLIKHNRRLQIIKLYRTRKENKTKYDHVYTRKKNEMVENTKLSMMLHLAENLIMHR